MVKTHIDKRDDMVVINGVIDDFTHSSVLKDFQCSQNPQLMGYG